MKILHSTGLVLCLFFAAAAFAQELPAFRVLYAENAIEKENAPETDPGQGMLLAFWRSDCAPCVTERPILEAIAREHPTLKVAMIALDGDDYKMRHFPPPPQPNMEIWLPETDADTALLQMGDIPRTLPFSVFLRKDGSTCERHQGLLGTELVNAWMKRC